MLKAAIEKIQEISKPMLFDFGGKSFLCDKMGGYTQIKEDLEMVESIGLSSLDAMIAFVKTEALYSEDRVFITIPDVMTVKCFTTPREDLRWNRKYLYTAKATDVPGWSEKTTLSFEEALIALRTRFQPATDTDYALRLLSNITTGGKVTYNDNGVATSIITKRGIDLQNNEAIKPIIKLRPYRTFQEIEQPESQFLIRINERGITFMEADGGMWKLEARKTIKKYLEAALSDEIAARAVVIVL